MTTYKCKCGRQVAKSTNADNTGNRDTTGCEGCPYLLPWGPTVWDDTRHAVVTDVKGYECRMSPELSYITELWGRVDDKCTMQINSLDFDFLERVSAWIKEHYPNSELSGGFSRAKMRACEFVTHGRYRMSICCAQNKAGMAAKAALVAAFFDPKSKTRLDIDPAAEKQLILNAIEAGKEAARRDGPKKEIINMDVAYKGPDGRLYRVSAQPDAKGGYYIEYRDPAGSAVYKPLPGYHHNANRDNVVDQLAGLIKELGLQAVMLEETAALTAPPAADIAAPGFDFSALGDLAEQAAEDDAQFNLHYGRAQDEYLIACVYLARIHDLTAKAGRYGGGTWTKWYESKDISKGSAERMVETGNGFKSLTVGDLKNLPALTRKDLRLIAGTGAAEAVVEASKTGDDAKVQELLAQLKATEQAKAEAEQKVKTWKEKDKFSRSRACEAERAAETLKQQIYRRNEELAEKEQALNTVLDQQGAYVAKVQHQESMLAELQDRLDEANAQLRSPQLEATMVDKDELERRAQELADQKIAETLSVQERQPLCDLVITLNNAIKSAWNLSGIEGREPESEDDDTSLEVLYETLYHLTEWVEERLAPDVYEQEEAIAT